MAYPTVQERRRLCEAQVTLDERPARISGWGLPFAQLSFRDGIGGVVEYAWETVARIVANGGAFRS